MLRSINADSPSVAADAGEHQRRLSECRCRCWRASMPTLRVSSPMLETINADSPSIAADAGEHYRRLPKHHGRCSGASTLTLRVSSPIWMGIASRNAGSKRFLQGSAPKPDDRRQSTHEVTRPEDRHGVEDGTRWHAQDASCHQRSRARPAHAALSHTAAQTPRAHAGPVPSRPHWRRWSAGAG